MPALRVNDIEVLLQPEFPAKHVKALLKHFRSMTEDFQHGEWESSIGSGGKFIEAALKALWVHVGKAPPTRARDFKAGVVMTELERLAAGSFDDAIRLTIPRACRFGYDIASNRGARHDPDEIDPNQMDARAVAGVAAWTLAEMVRYSQKGSVDEERLVSIVESITARQYPLVEEVDGRVYFHLDGLSAKDVAVLSLWRRYPGRLTAPELIAAIRRHGFKKRNAEVALTRLGGLVDYDDGRSLRLLQPGIKLAERLMARNQ